MYPDSDVRVCDPFVTALKADRDALNTMFAQHRMSGSEIDAGEFVDHLIHAVDPLVARIHEIIPERVRTVVNEVYQCSLSLFASSLLGSNAKVGEINDIFHRLLPTAAPHVARAPAQVVASLCNAAYNLSAQSETDSARWIERMTAISHECNDVSSFLACGQIIAWQCGMAQYREGALEIADKLSPKLAARVLGLSSNMETAQLSDVINQLKSDPWMTPEAAAAEQRPPSTIKCVRIVGAFVGTAAPFWDLLKSGTRSRDSMSPTAKRIGT